MLWNQLTNRKQSSDFLTVENFNCDFSTEGFTQKRVANLWTEFSAQRRYWLIANGKEPQNPNKLVVAATCEVAKT